MVDHQSVNSNWLQRYPLFGILTIFSFCAPGVSMVSFFGSSARFNRVLKNQNVRVLKFLTICRIFFEGASKNHPISCDYFLATIKQTPSILFFFLCLDYKSSFFFFYAESDSAFPLSLLGLLSLLERLVRLAQLGRLSFRIVYFPLRLWLKQ